MLRPVERFLDFLRGIRPNDYTEIEPWRQQHLEWRARARRLDTRVRESQPPGPVESFLRGLVSRSPDASTPGNKEEQLKARIRQLEGDLREYMRICSDQHRVLVRMREELENGSDFMLEVGIVIQRLPSLFRSMVFTDGQDIEVAALTQAELAADVAAMLAALHSLRHLSPGAAPPVIDGN